MTEQRPSKELPNLLRKFDKEAQDWSEYGCGYGLELLIPAADEIERLTQCLATANANHERFEREWYLRGDEIERHEEAFHRIKQWAEAYPLDVFPEPDLKRSAQVLKDAGLSLDRISAKAMRHVITQVQAIVDGALRAAQPPGDGQ